MIKLKIDNETLSFDQDTVLIGKGDVDFEISGEEIEDHHLKIELTHGRVVVSNLSNDPFVALNSLPFGKKTLKEHDQITVGTCTIEFLEGKESPKELPSDPEPTEEEENQVLEALVKRAVEEVKNEQLEELDPETPAIIEEEEDLPVIFDEPELEEEPAEEIEEWEPDFQQSEIGSTILANSNWRLVATFLFAFITMSTLVASGVYFRASGKNSQEEKKVAAGVADIAMALSTAQLYNITPNKMNWSDPDFLHTHMKLVLSSDLHPQAHLNSQGQLTETPYFLRIYTSSDTSRFLVIAQPNPNMLQWFVHKKTIVIDSTAMEVRKIVNLKALNRLLANTNPLEGANGEVLSRLVTQGELMPLPSLAGKKNRWGFNPPSSLAMYHPNAENYVYNAPRYYPFGEAVLQRALSLNENLNNSYEVSMLQQEMEKISKFKDIVLYSSQGVQTALEAQKALHTFAPKSQFLIAFLDLNPQGIVTGSHLLLDDESNELALADRDNAQDEMLDHLATEEEIHPLYLQLNALLSNRERTLSPLSQEMAQLLTEQTAMKSKGFYNTFLTLLEEYQRIDTYQDRKIAKGIADLQKDYSELPFETFMRYVKEAGLVEYIQPAMSHAAQIPSEKIENNLKAIEHAKNLNQLEKIVADSAKILQLENFSDLDQIVPFQDQVREKTLQRVAFLLLSPTTSYNPKMEDLPKLDKTLRLAWVTDEDEFNYFISEFHALFL